MLPKPNQLPAYLIPEVLKKGKKYYSPLLTLIVSNDQKPGFKLEKPGFSLSRFSIIIPTRLDKRATKRNKLKRQIRNIIKFNLANLKLGLDMVIMAKKTIINQDFATMKNELEKIFGIAKLLV